MYQRKRNMSRFYFKINSNYEKQTILLMIPNEGKKGWYYLAVKKLSTLLKRIPWKTHGDFWWFSLFELTSFF